MRIAFVRRSAWADSIFVIGRRSVLMVPALYVLIVSLVMLVLWKLSGRI